MTRTTLTCLHRAGLLLGLTWTTQSYGQEWLPTWGYLPMQSAGGCPNGNCPLSRPQPATCPNGQCNTRMWSPTRMPLVEGVQSTFTAPPMVPQFSQSRAMDAAMKPATTNPESPYYPEPTPRNSVRISTQKQNLQVPARNIESPFYP